MIKNIYKKTVHYIHAIENIIDKKEEAQEYQENYKFDPFSVLSGRIPTDVKDYLKNVNSDLSIETATTIKDQHVQKALEDYLGHKEL